MLQPRSPVAPSRPELQAAIGQESDKAEEQQAAHHPHGGVSLVLRTTENQGGFVQSVESGAVVARGVSVLAGDAEDVDGGWHELMEDKRAKGVRNSLLTVEVLA